MQMFYEQLIAARKAKGMTQDTLAREAAVTRQAVSSWERGRTIPDIDTIRRLSDILGADLISSVGEGSDSRPDGPDGTPTDPAAAPSPRRLRDRMPWLIAGVAALVCVALLLCLLLPRGGIPADAGEAFDAALYRQANPDAAGSAYITFDNRTWTESNGGTDYQRYDFTMTENHGVGFSVSRIESKMASTRSGAVRAFTVSAADISSVVDPEIAPYGSLTIDGGYPMGEFNVVGITVYGEDANGAPLTFRDLIEF